MRFIKRCRICEIEFNKKTNGKYCSDYCKKQANVLSYHKRTKEKKCGLCGENFLGKKQEINCLKCKGKRKKYFIPEVEVTVVCRKCNRKLYKETKKDIGRVGDHIKKGKSCQFCIDKKNKNISERMKKNNPMKNPETRVKMASTVAGKELNIENYREIKEKKYRMSKKELSLFHSDRMKNNNPMKNKECVLKVKKTLIERYRNNEIKKKYGKDHWFWKGNRKRSFIIRSRLYTTWIKPILERDDFSCCKCGIRGGKLEVHHIFPSFREILEATLSGRKLDELSDDDFEILSLDVLERHKKATGITYCKDCHKEVDPQRR